MAIVGIDVGSVATKVVIMEGEKIFHDVRPTGWSPREMARRSLDDLMAAARCREEDILYSVGTGYGRVSLPSTPGEVCIWFRERRPSLISAVRTAR